MRPLEVFVKPVRFSKPRNSAEAGTRLELNLSYFLSNYVVLSFLLASYAIVSKPPLLISAIILAVVWSVAVQPTDFVWKGIVIPAKNKVLLASVGTTVVLLLAAGTVLLVVMGLSSTTVILHAVFHAGATQEELNALNFPLDDVDDRDPESGKGAQLLER
eukprot:CAMPEP_0175125166 /NCGR_PEP_ID=MMETSP0087-20121206/3167_1 /TAXON_ID=136419 /ORGANISM="Unknown Unknown, Strain D1" /LENGTH=159 /DNA_ID=CAMNT_0016406977 /DNA_START=53 /DNA_END=532 /DNA_ORIENTATION=+